MTDTPDISDTSDQNTPETKSSTRKKTTKKTTKKKVAKKTTKKAASKKTTTKKTSKRAAKNSAKKASRKKVSSKNTSEDIDSIDNQSDEIEAEESMPVINESQSQDDPEEGPWANENADADDQEEIQGEAQGAEDSEVSEEPVRRPRRRSTKKPVSKKTTKRVASSGLEPKPVSKPSPKPVSRPASKPAKKSNVQAEMIINYVPGEECRVAMVENGKLEELMVEPTDRVSRVGNIYVGRVANIEPSIQAVFVDFGTEENGFLHISDLHPQYFAKGDDKTERVGKKTPRKSRPPIQDCLKRGQEIIVQVLKEGVGTKGPTLTSYLSIPGRFLVMMPGMDKVGVSRKEEDEDKRKAAKQILSQLDLPDGFGFILRTAGFDRTKAELKRDLSYLGRLWRDMESRKRGGKKPRLLYTESDLLVRSIRDLLTSEVSRVVIDSEPALKRVARFIKIAAPRSGAKLSHYTGTKPIFHAFGIERQIDEIHAREVMLPSGGRLVIDQTEALVAIDVNSGKSRAARDAETNAFKTNMEAVDAICRQLRLRDLGGLVVNDMIDMRFHTHRKEVEARFTERLRRDRAKTSTAPISPFGLLEMTRQRMRGSLESQHFADCPTCHGRGLVKRPDSVASSALRDLAALLDHPRVYRAELVVNPRVASSLLSTRRSSLTRIELISGKMLDVRVSESLPIDRVSFYAYDESGADLSIENLKPANGQRAEPSVVEWRDESSPDGSWAMDPNDEVDETTVQKLAEEIARKADMAEHVKLPVEGDLDDDGEPFKKKRRRRRGGRGRGRSEEQMDGEESSRNESTRTERSAEGSSQGSGGDQQDQQTDQQTGQESSREVELDENGEPIKKKRRRRRRGGRGRTGSDEGRSEDSGSESGSDSSSDSSSEQREPRARVETRSEERSNNSDDEPQRSRRRPRRRPLKNAEGETSTEASRDSSRSTNEQQSQTRKPEPEADRVAEAKPTKRPRRRSRSNSTESESSKSTAPIQKTQKQAAPETKKETPKPKVRRGLYSNSRRTLTASELAKLGLE